MSDPSHPVKNSESPEESRSRPIAEVSVSAELWHNFYLECFVVAPSLIAAKHTFTFAEKEIVVALPTIREPLTPHSQTPINEYIKISCNHWHKTCLMSIRHCSIISIVLM
jgi:hypothetical protein